MKPAARTLGRDFGRASIERFDLQSSIDSLRFVPLERVPHCTFDPAVVDARWRASLEHVDWSETTGWEMLSPARA